MTVAHELSGESFSETGFGLATYTTVALGSFTPVRASGTIVFDTDLGQPSVHDGTGWEALAIQSALDLQISKLIKRSMPIVFNGTLPDSSVIYRFPANTEMTFYAANTSSIATVDTTPSGTAGTWTISKDDVVVANLSIAAGMTSGTVVWIADTVFNLNDKFSVESVTQNGATGLSINLQVFLTDI